MTSRSGSTPVQCRTARAPWPTSIPSPSRVRRAALLRGPQQGRARRRDDDVGHHEAGPQAVEVEVDEGLGVAEADRGGVDDDVGALGHGIRAGPRARSRPAPRCRRSRPGPAPRRGARSRLTTMTDAAPASAVSTATARAAPPAPSTTRSRPAGSTTVRSDSTKPWPSVLWPTSRPSVATTVLTAPITSADGARPSRWSMTATLCGSEQLKPAQPIARAPATASASAAGRDLAVEVAGVEPVVAVGGLDHDDGGVARGGRGERAGVDAEEGRLGRAAVGGCRGHGFRQPRGRRAVEARCRPAPRLPDFFARCGRPHLSTTNGPVRR